jgi:signal transduction histidine kinase
MGKTRNLDLAQLARDCVALVRQNPDVGREVHFTMAGPDRPVLVPGDADLLHRVVLNLVLNAAQFAGPSGRVRVEIRSPGECAAPPGTEIRSPACLSVSDSGPGVDPDDLPRIFDPFYTNRPGGSGLGLALVHRAVEAHQGTILVGRAPEGGAEFTILLPGEPSLPAENVS